MSDFYRKKSNAFTAFLKDKSFYIILFASIVMVCIAGWLALGSGDETETTPPQNSQVENEGGYSGETPTWPEEDQSNNTVGTNVDDVPAEDPVQTETPQEPEKVYVKYECPVENFTTVFAFSGTMPVFSETLQDWRLHTGIDYFTEGEESVLAAADGIIEDVYDDGLMGVTVVVSHVDDVKTIYQSLADNVKVIKGAEVHKGDIIGHTGTTADSESTGGCHVHFSVLKDGGYLNPTEIYE